jgi:hypothetical protein
MVRAFKNKLEGKRSRKSDQQGTTIVPLKPKERSDHPLSQTIQCSRCGEWFRFHSLSFTSLSSLSLSLSVSHTLRGHRDGEAVCPMKNFNPHDWARQKQEEPEVFMKESLYQHKQKLILRHASLPAEMRPTDHQLVHSEEEEEQAVGDGE